MEKYMLAFWIVMLVAFVVIEASTAQLLTIWFAVGSLAALISQMLGADIWLQWLIFVAVSAIVVAATRPLVKKYARPKVQPTNADRCIGQTAVVTEDIDNIAGKGAVKVNGIEWRGEGSVNVTANDKFTANQKYTVVIGVACEDNGTFATGVTATVNGQTAEVNRLNDKQVIITFEGFETGDCECKCHTGNFFFKIVLFFQKLFGMNKVCICGEKH